MAENVRQIVIGITTKLLDGAKAFKELAAAGGKAVGEIHSKAGDSATAFLRQAVSFTGAVQAATSAFKALNVALDDNLSPVQKARSAIGALPSLFGELGGSAFDFTARLVGLSQTARREAALMGEAISRLRSAEIGGAARRDVGAIDRERQERRNRITAQGGFRSPEVQRIVASRLDLGDAQQAALAEQDELLGRQDETRQLRERLRLAREARESAGATQPSPLERRLDESFAQARKQEEIQARATIEALERLKRAADEAAQAQPRNRQLQTETQATVDSVLQTMKQLRREMAAIQGDFLRIEQNRNAYARALGGG
jgi:hypothetical protein